MVVDEKKDCVRGEQKCTTKADYTIYGVDYIKINTSN